MHALLEKRAKPKRYVTTQRYITVDVDIRDYLDPDDGAPGIDANEAELLLHLVDEARRCLSRHERSPSEALALLERATPLVERIAKAAST